MVVVPWYHLPDVVAVLDLLLARVAGDVAANPHITSDLKLVMLMVQSSIPHDLIIIHWKLPVAGGWHVPQIRHAAAVDAHVPHHDGVAVGEVFDEANFGDVDHFADGEAVGGAHF